MSASLKAARELEIFNSFTDVCPAKIDKATIENREPREPDICCRTHSGEKIGFELTELIDKRHMERVAMMDNTKSALREFSQKLEPPEKQRQFDEFYGNALIHFDFSEASSLKSRKTKFQLAFDLLTQCPDFISDIGIKNNPDLLPVLQSIRVRKSRINGPIIDVSGFGWLGDPTQAAIENKLGKTYECDYPVELVAYIDWDILPPEGAWKAAADRAVEQLDGSQFRRVWVYNTNSKSIDYVYPE